MHEAGVTLERQANELAKLAEKKLNFRLLTKSNIVREGSSTCVSWLTAFQALIIVFSLSFCTTLTTRNFEYR